MAKLDEVILELETKINELKTENYTNQPFVGQITGSPTITQSDSLLKTYKNRRVIRADVVVLDREFKPITYNDGDELKEITIKNVLFINPGIEIDPAGLYYGVKKRIDGQDPSVSQRTGGNSPALLDHPPHTHSNWVGNFPSFINNLFYTPAHGDIVFVQPYFAGNLKIFVINGILPKDLVEVV